MKTTLMVTALAFAGVLACSAGESMGTHSRGKEHAAWSGFAQAGTPVDLAPCGPTCGGRTARPRW